MCVHLCVFGWLKAIHVWITLKDLQLSTVECFNKILPMLYIDNHSVYRCCPPLNMNSSTMVWCGLVDYELVENESEEEKKEDEGRMKGVMEQRWSGEHKSP